MVNERNQLPRRFIVRGAKGLGKTGLLGKDQENQYLESAVLMELHNRSCWFERAYSYAAEHLRGVVSEEGDRLGIDCDISVEATVISGGFDRATKGTRRVVSR